jgi:hypothetical protein
MLYVHSFSLIEQTIFNHLQSKQEVLQLDAQLMVDQKYIVENAIATSTKTIIYSFQQVDYYKYYETFERECVAVDNLIEYALKNGTEKIILLTYPGAYISSDNLFLQHKGIIEKKFHDTKLAVTYLHVQAIANNYQQVHTLHQLFYNAKENSYVIPKKSCIMVYSISIHNLIDIIQEAHLNNHIGHFDVFDKIQHLESFLKINASHVRIQRIPPTYLLVKSYFGNYISPTMMELFLRPTLPMYSYRTEKAFGVELNSTKPFIDGYYQAQDYHVSPVFGTKGFSLST